MSSAYRTAEPLPPPQPYAVLEDSAFLTRVRIAPLGDGRFRVRVDTILRRRFFYEVPLFAAALLTPFAALFARHGSPIDALKVAVTVFVTAVGCTLLGHGLVASGRRVTLAADRASGQVTREGGAQVTLPSLPILTLEREDVGGAGRYHLFAIPGAPVGSPAVDDLFLRTKAARLGARVGEEPRALPHGAVSLHVSDSYELGSGAAEGLARALGAIVFDLASPVPAMRAYDA